VQVPVLCTLSLAVKNIKIRIDHPVKHNGLDRTSVTVGKFNRQALVWASNTEFNRNPSSSFGDEI
jgi:hypothetical protein